ncbi:nucleoside deaminase [Psychromonas sp. MB-3u-54]|uniref:nucleoside deaminase n=1 Tax=Psychromonas sp. MB-3u-54 TaxID=2058319 RepID=UPI000C34D100|nr:nucleoside deaminase [Psychromonas sp. MB-3u-54]PKH03235.1 nucleoside deaminase [Psychromonas sp. MB-3u-54]
MDDLTELKKALLSHRIDRNFPEESLGKRCCEIACVSLENGCYGVGAILVDKTDNILIEAGNEIFLKGFHSARHAEMLVIDRFELQYPKYGDRSGLTMMVSLEPCPMCLTRLLLAGIGEIVYLANDDAGGMAGRIDRMPPAWINLASLQNRRLAKVSNTLESLATRLAACRLGELRNRLLANIR